MKFSITIFIYLLTNATVFAQNLVPNSGFENYKQLPINILTEKIDSFVIDWHAPTNGTPDYFNKKAPLNSIVSPPLLSDFFQKNQFDSTCNVICHPITGSGFVGFESGFNLINHKDTFWGNEYIQSRLKENLQKNHRYKVTFNIYNVECNQLELPFIGVLLTPFKPTHNYIPDITKPFDYKIATNFLETYTPQIRMGDYSSVKGQWIKIEQNYKSLTNEEFITIGNFSQSSFKITIQAPTKERNIGYFFIDDVSIIELPGIIAPDSTCYNEITALQSGLPGPFAWYKNNVLFSTDSIVYVTDTTNNWYHLHTPFGNDSLYLIIKDKPTLEVVPKITICQGDTINLKAVSNANDLVWLFNSSATNTTVTLAGTYVAIASRNGCLTQDTTIVSLVSKPQITINDEQFCSASLEKVNITLPIWYKYYWTTFNDSLYQRNIDSAAKYTIIIIDTNACKTQTSFNVIDMCSPIVFVPNAFVPNGVNSTFKPTFSYVKSVKLEIYNRWGNLVFSTTEQDQAWDGTFEGKAADTGTYIYNIIYTDSHNKEYQIKGNLSLIR